MRFLAIFDSFKGTIKSQELGKMTADYLKSQGHEASFMAMSDGGDGFLESLALNMELSLIKVKTCDALRRPIETFYGKKGSTAYIEMASSVGINQLEINELNPFVASTFGLGLVINDVLKSGVDKIVIGIGGSATNDAGSGMLEALGVKFYSNDKLITGLNNEKLKEIDKIDFTSLEDKFKSIEVEIICDVNNFLFGENGATYVYAKQKGATEEMLPLLEENIIHFSSLVSFEGTMLPGAGAAGGIGWALGKFLNAKFNPGVDYFLSIIDYEEKIKNYDIIITGEGKFDKSSLNNKAVMGIINHTQNKNIIIIAGSSDIEDYKYPIYSVVPSVATLNESLSNPIETFMKLLKTIKF